MGSMASTGSSAILTMFGGDNATSVLYWWQAFGTKPWHQETVGTDLSGFGWPAIAWTGKAAVIAAVDNGGNLYYWWQAVGTKPWHRQHVASGLAPVQPATIAWTGGGGGLVVIAAVDAAGNIQYWWQKVGTAPWNNQRVARAGVKTDPLDPPVVAYNPPAIAATESFVGIVATDSNGNLNYWQQTIGTAPWNQTVVPPAVSGRSYVAPDIASTGDTVVITFVDNSGNLYYVTLESLRFE